MPPFPTVDESRDRLHRAGWSVGDAAFGILWHVIGTNGENAIDAGATTQSEPRRSLTRNSSLWTRLWRNSPSAIR
jgi:hypothetical protein